MMPAGLASIAHRGAEIVSEIQHVVGFHGAGRCFAA
jgi:hypothetical protein